MTNTNTQISLTIQYGVTDGKNGIEESDTFSCDFDKFPTRQEVLEAWSRGTIYDLEENREDVSFYFFATAEDNNSLECDYEW